jgi:Mg-chelatase subunit ChlD
MPRLMRCLYCGLLQDEPEGVKICARCGGELAFEEKPAGASYVRAQMELDQITAPAGQPVQRHLVLTIETPPQVPQEEAAATTAGREPLNLSAVIDVSGSMRGPKIEAAKEAVRQAIDRLHDGDLLSLVAFASEVSTVLNPTVVDSRLRSEATDVVARLAAGGQTALCGGLDAGIAAALTNRQETNLVLLLSDGQANVGEQDLEKVGARALEARGRGVTVSTLGVGSDYNEALMVEIANQGGGRFYHVLHAHQIVPYVAGELGEAGAVAAREASITLSLPDATGLQLFSSAYKVTSQSVVALGDIPVDTQMEVVLRLQLPGQEAGSRIPIEGVLSYRSPAGTELTSPLNVVTVRYVPAPEFRQADGAVAPVVRRVLDQMKARSVLLRARTAAAHGQARAREQASTGLAEMRTYASLLGEREAEEYAAEQEKAFAALDSSPRVAKAVVSSAYRRQRGTKAFDK